MRRLAVLSLHTSPLAQPGTGDGGGMNVYVRELSSALARAGVECDVFTRAWSDDLPATVSIEPGFRVHHVSAGPPTPIAKESLPGVVDEFADGVLKRMQTSESLGTAEDLPFDAVHANYWLSGMAGHIIKHRMNVPLVSTFHTLDRVKAEASPEEVEADSPHRRAEAEAAIIQCSDTVLASCSVEAAQIHELYDADPSRIRIVAPGVDHAFFGPGDRRQARRALGLPGQGPLLLFVGRIQPLKGVAVAVRAVAALADDHPDARLVVVGGPSGPQGEAEVERTRAIVHELGLGERVVFVPPRPHELLSTYYRAADVCLVPSRSESFGLVALEAAACGTPVVASDVGGLRSLIDHGRTGYLVEEPSPEAFAAWVRQILAEPLLAERLSTGAVLRARRYTWARAAHLLREIYAELTVGRLVECS
ncbi:MAG TPA: glycosyltransferase [Acidimicrobiales bacterium]|jgi:D-inositol-3-phosphate glycosyltransferase|nr:glycosyltransferase [Acidimicrobiales bacterium]